MNFSGVNSNGVPRGIYGCLAQIWIAPNNDGNYTQTMPGFRLENNSFPSEFNLDSHFLGDPTNFVVTSPLEEGNVDFPGFNPILANDTFGYGNGRDFSFAHALALTGYLRGAFDIISSQQQASLDLAYITLGGGGEIHGEVYTTGGTFEMAIGFATGPQFPEPSLPFVATGCLLILASRKN